MNTSLEFIAWTLLLLSVTIAVSESLPIVTFNGSSLLNHSLVYFSEIGNSDHGNDSLQCHTGAGENGGWFFPNGTVIPEIRVSGIYQYHARNRVDLRLRRNFQNQPSGIYYCRSNGSGYFYIGLNAVGRGFINASMISVNSTAIRMSVVVSGLIDFVIKLDWSMYNDYNCPPDIGTTNLTMNITDLAISNLQSGRLYNISLSEETTEFCEKVEIAIMTTITVPSASPTIVMITSTSTSISLSWNPIYCKQVLNYIVIYKNAENEYYQIIDSSASNTSISLLKPSTNYSIKVAAVNAAGVGLFSNPVAIRTKSMIINTLIGYTFIALYWESNENTINTTIHYFNTNNTDCSNISRKYSTHQNHINLTRLEEGTQYNITLTTFFNDESLVLQNINLTTPVTVPTGSPQSVTAIVRSSTSYDIHWDPIDCRDRNGQIIGYVLSYSGDGDESRHQISIQNALKHELENLSKSTTYEVKIAGQNVAGLGLFSNAIIFKTPQSNFLSLNGNVVANDSYVNISNIGSIDSTALVCHTQYDNPRGRATGDWYGPEGERVHHTFPETLGFIRNRGHMVVQLIRLDYSIPQEGQYICNIMSSVNNFTILIVRLFSISPGNVTVSSDAIFTETSHLNGSSSEFIIMCTSMGGIPANVTWLRNGYVINIDSYLLLVNLPSQTYNYSLEVKGRYEGLYTCLVRGLYNSDSANISVQAPPIPIGIYVVQSGFNSVRVSWAPGGELVTGYLVSYSLRGNTQVTKETTTSAISLGDLVMEESYSIGIIATSNTLSSLPANTTAYIGKTTVSVSHYPSLPVAGEQVNLTCSLSLPETFHNNTVSIPKLVWEHKGQQVMSSYSVTSSLIVFSRVSASQAGVYSCKATLISTIISNTTLLMRIPVPKPSVIVTSSSPVIMAESSMTLYCNYSLSEYVDIDGVKITVTWKRNNNLIKRKELLFEDSLHFTIFFPVTTADSGRYTCSLNITSNTDYTITQSPRESEEKLLLIQIPQPKVAIWIQLSGRHYPGANITLTCTISVSSVVNNNETVSVQWILPSDQSNARYSITSLKEISRSTYNSQVIINPLTEQDAGNVTCVGVIIGRGAIAKNSALISLVLKESIVILEDLTTSDTTQVTIMWNMNINVVATHLNISYSNLNNLCLNDRGSFTLPNLLAEAYTLVGLEEHIMYSISISVIKSGYVIGGATTTVITEADVPSAAPSEFNVTEVTSSSVKVIWKPVICIHQNGEITGYIIHYRENDNGTNNTIDIPGENTTELNINGLKPSTRYNISIAAVNTKGTGKYTTREVTTNTAENSLDTVILGSSVAGAVVGLTLLVFVALYSCVFIQKQWKLLQDKTKKLSSSKNASNSYVCDNEDFIDESPKRGIEMKSFASIVDLTNNDGCSDIPVAQFPEYVKHLHENEDEILKQQYMALEGMTLPLSEIAQLKSNSKHNRFKNILPYDFNRVILNRDEDESDYINVSLIDGDKDGTKSFIAAQGPTEATVERFLEMIWLYNVPTIVMLTRCVEDGRIKCKHYWLDQLETTLTVGKYNVTLKSYISLAEYHIRKLQLTKIDEPEKEMCVTHMLYTAWPDHGVPNNAMSLISFIRRVRRKHPASLSQRLLVHCSAGVGRTGTFILLDLAIQQKMNKGKIGVLSQLKELRKQRMKPIQTQMNYNFVHDALSELVICGETEIEAANIMTTINKLHRQVTGDITGMTGLKKQFQKLVELSSQSSDMCEEAKRECNKDKNRFPDVLPNGYHCVRLRYDGEEGSDYINASFVDESCCCFWPQESSVNTEAEEVYGKLKVTLKSISPCEDITLRNLVVEEAEGKSLNHKHITLLQLNSWLPWELPHPTSILTLINMLGVAQRSCPSKHTVIMCSDGVGRTGTFICIHSQLERLKTEGVVDFFQGIKSARIQRAGLVPDSVHYTFCHNVVVTYLDSFDTYANFKILDS